VGKTGAIHFECRINVGIGFVWPDVEELTRDVTWTTQWGDDTWAWLDVKRELLDESTLAGGRVRTVGFRGVVIHDYGFSPLSHREWAIEDLTWRPAVVSLTRRGPERTDLAVEGSHGAADQLWPVVARLATLYDDVRGAILRRPDLTGLADRYPTIAAIRDEADGMLQLRRNGQGDTRDDQPRATESGRPNEPRPLTLEQRLRLEEFHESGMTQEDWCDEHRHELGYPSLRTLRNWLRKEEAEDS
jgi:hypothetical protein